MEGRAGMESLLESKIGEPTAKEGPSSQLRRFYTNNYGALDRFDRLWYEMRYLIRPRDWESHFCWSLLHAAVINARSVWCAAREQRIPLRDFLQSLIATFAASL